MKIKEYVLMVIGAAIAIDVLIVFWAMMQIASGADVPHIPFWDAQIRLIASLMK